MVGGPGAVLTNVVFALTRGPFPAWTEYPNSSGIVFRGPSDVSPSLPRPTPSPWLVLPLCHRPAPTPHLPGPAVSLSALQAYRLGVAGQPSAVSTDPSGPIANRFRSAGGVPLRSGSSARADRGRLFAACLEAVADPSRPSERPLGSDASRRDQHRRALVETSATAVPLGRMHPTLPRPIVPHFFAGRLSLFAAASPIAPNAFGGGLRRGATGRGNGSESSHTIV
jgi:hypothetical protein